jgi:hypothetical protein
VRFVRFLVLDHFFGQDIEALRAALEPGDELRTISYDVLRAESLRIFPQRVASGLEPLSDPAFEQERQAWAAELRSILHAELSRFPFDVLISPSDLFFYARALPAVCHEVGVPFVVVQKETTVAPNTMREHAAAVALHAPPVADAMTSCSERQKEFWVRAGAAPDSIAVTGQPRFDVYGTSDHEPRPDGRRLLFFSYHADAYHPSGAGGSEGEPAWSRLHHETEQGLWELAARGWDVTIKPHPQQDFRADRQRLAAAMPAAAAGRVRFAENEADARELILAADVVVGFQTTALIESMAAGRPVVYTGWDAQARRLAGELIPFGDWRDVLSVVDAPEDLVEAVEGARGRRLSGDAADRARAIWTEYLGPVDGRAAERALAVVRGCSEAYAAARTPEVAAFRERVVARRAPLELSRRGRRAISRVRRKAGALRDRAYALSPRTR